MPNRYTGTDNDPFQEAQHNYLGPQWAAFFKSLEGKRVNLGPIGLKGGGYTQSQGLLPAPGGEDVARSGAINAYLGELTDQNALRHQGQLDMAAHNQARDVAERDRQTANRAMAIANTPGVSQFGRPIAQREDRASFAGSSPTYTTLRPNPNDPQPPVNRQALAAQMAPGLIAPPAPPPPVTYAAPVKAVVNGKSVFVRPGSDGQIYGMDRRPITSGLEPPPDKDTPRPPAAAPVDASGQPITGDALLQTLPAAKQKMLTAVLEGRQAIPSGAALKDPYWKDIIETANLVDPNFDTVNFNARSGTRKDFTSGKAAGQINAINTVIGHLSDLSDTSEGLKNTGLNWVNEIYNKLTPGGSQRGVAINNFETLKEGVATELMRTWRQVGAGSEKEIEDWKAQLTAAKSPEEFKGAFKTIGGMLESKLSALDSQYKQGMGTDRVTAISDASRKRLDKLQGAAAGAPAGGTIRAVDTDGNVHEAKAGTPLPPGWKLQGGG